MRLFFYKILLTKTLLAIWLTKDQAVLDSPFDVASIGWKINILGFFLSSQSTSHNTFEAQRYWLRLNYYNFKRPNC